MCANIKRNDPVTRRFLQYLSMQSCEVCVLIRDAKTSEILRSPPDKELWLHRQKSGIGRASKNEWTVVAEVGQAFFEKSRCLLCNRFSISWLLNTTSGESQEVAFRIQRIL